VPFGLWWWTAAALLLWVALDLLLVLWLAAVSSSRVLHRLRARRGRHFFPVCDPDPARGFATWLEQWDGKLPEWLSQPR